MLRRGLLFTVLMLFPSTAVSPAAAQQTPVRLDLTGRWGLETLVVEYFCYQYKRSGYVDLRPKAGAAKGTYTGSAWYQIERIPKKAPGCLPVPPVQRDRVTVEVIPCHTEELPRVRKTPRRGPCYHTHFRRSAQGIGYAAEFWVPRPGHILVWGSRFALPYKARYTRVTPPGG